MKWKWKSIASKYSLFTVCLVLTQSLLVLGLGVAHAEGLVLETMPPW